MKKKQIKTHVRKLKTINNKTFGKNVDFYCLKNSQLSEMSLKVPKFFTKLYRDRKVVTFSEIQFVPILLTLRREKKNNKKKRYY